MAPTQDTFVHRWFERVWNKGDVRAIDDMMSADALMHGLGEAGADVRGPDGFKPFQAKLRGAFPDIQVSIDETVEQGDLIASRWTANMTHLGDDLGVPATGRRVTVTGMSMARLRDGIMVEGWNNWDTMSLMQQISGDDGAPPVRLVD